MAETLAARSRLLGNFRGLSFSALLVSLGYFLFGSNSVGGWLALALGVVFLLLVARHGRVIDAEDHARRLSLVNERAEARIDGRFAGLPDLGLGLVGPEHPYAGDLDLFGSGSLFQRLSVAHTHFGKGTLADWLAHFASLTEIAERQAAVRELASALGFRQEFEAQAMALSERRREGKTEIQSSPDPESFLRWIEAPAELAGKPLVLALAWLLPVLTFGGIAAHWFANQSPLYWVAPLLVGLAVLARYQKTCTDTFNAVSTTEGAFLRYGDLLALIEGLEPNSPWLVARRATLTASNRPEVSASRTMRRFRNLVSWYDLRHNGMVYPFVDGLLLWDIHCSAALERWKRDVGPRARAWFAVIGELEALSSLAGFLHDEPDAVFPTLTDDSSLEAKALGHPLIARSKRITNDLDAFAPGQALLVTGSNMSGKSTFLRALGINTVLAFSGAPVIAASLTLPRCVLGTSIRISDSLLSGTSHFFAEVKKLAHVVQLSKGETPVLFLMDEVLHGTNSRERQLGARWVLAELLRDSAFGILTTHDEGLCELPPELMPRVRQHHFRENVADGEMTFDYCLRQGPVTSGNALRLMRQVGLDVPLEG